MSATTPAAPDCDPPPRHPAPASHKLPAGTCDTHFHVFGEPGRFPMDPRRNYTPHVCTLNQWPNSQLRSVPSTKLPRPGWNGST